VSVSEDRLYEAAALLQELRTIATVGWCGPAAGAAGAAGATGIDDSRGKVHAKMRHDLARPRAGETARDGEARWARAHARFREITDAFTADPELRRVAGALLRRDGLTHCPEADDFVAPEPGPVAPLVGPVPAERAAPAAPAAPAALAAPAAKRRAPITTADVVVVVGLVALVVSAVLAALGLLQERPS
jgi:hypothetical protein